MTAPEPTARPSRSRWVSHLGTVALVLIVFLGVQAWQTRHVSAALDTAAPTQWLAADGSLQSGRLQDAIDAVRRPGQPVALYVWADWCPICRAQQGSIDRLGQDWPVLTVAMQSGEAAQVWRYQQQHGLGWHTVIDPRGQLSRELGFRSVPAFVVIDPHDRLRHPTVGYTSAWGMRARLWLARLL